MGRTASGVHATEALSPASSATSATPPAPASSATPAYPATDVSAGTVSHALPGDLTAVREARTVVQQVLGTWRAETIFDDVALVASELVANALRHGLPGEPSPVGGPGPDDRDAVRISLVSTGSHVICAVTDPSGTPPVRRDVDPLAGSGRGLQIVESLSLCWGWTVLDADAGSPVEDGRPGAAQGKSVWAIFPLASPQVVGAA